MCTYLNCTYDGDNLLLSGGLLELQLLLDGGDVVQGRPGDLFPVLFVDHHLTGVNITSKLYIFKSTLF